MGSRRQPQLNLSCPVKNCKTVLPTRQGLRRHLRSVHKLSPKEKECTRCHKTKSLSHFHLIDPGIMADGSLPMPIHRSACRQCHGQLSNIRKQNRKITPEFAAAERIRRRRRRAARVFGMTLVELETAEAKLLKLQKGKCPICRKNKCDVLDHDHKTGKLRGLICRKCNFALGYISDDPATAERLATYLRETGGF